MVHAAPRNTRSWNGSEPESVGAFGCIEESSKSLSSGFRRPVALSDCPEKRSCLRSTLGSSANLTLGLLPTCP